MTEFFERIVVVALFAIVGLTGCTGDAADAKTGASSSTTKRVAKTSAGSIDLGAASYKPATGSFGNPSVVSGTIRLNDPITADAYEVTKDQAVCGTTAPGAVSPPGKSGGFANTVVWIADVKTGKPLPMDKREELSSEKCLVEPRVQAAVVGTTFNVFNDDKLLHRLVFLDADTHDTLTVMPFFNAGQVVASERLAKKSGIIEVRCSQHPWTRGYIVVFDHPYYDVTDAEGRFKIDSLPAGTYRVMAWHEGMAKPFSQQVQVWPGGEAKLDLKLAVGQ